MLEKIHNWFHWPGMVAEVQRFCQQCPQCQCQYYLGLTKTQYLSYSIGWCLLKPHKRWRPCNGTPALSPKTGTYVLGACWLLPLFCAKLCICSHTSFRSDQEGRARDCTMDAGSRVGLLALKRALTSSPVLRNLDFNHPFLVQTDASETGPGAILSQEFD